jgi:hypothetical protein
MTMKRWIHSLQLLKYKWLHVSESDEIRTKKFFVKVQRIVSKKLKLAQIALRGDGRTWIEIRCNERLVKVHVFVDLNGDLEHLVFFQEDHETLGSGRARVSQSAIDASIAWLSEMAWLDLYQKFDFVESAEKFQISIRNSLVKNQPVLANLKNEIKRGSQDFCDQRFLASNRSVEIKLWGPEKEQWVSFMWHNSKMFELRNHDHVKLAPVIGSWLHEQDMPSAMNQKFPWLETGKLAQFYEQGRELEGEFVVSWDGIEGFYAKEPMAERSGPLLKLIAEMRVRGFEKSFRAGTSMTTLIFSRSKDHGLRSEQPYICLSGSERGVDLEIYMDGKHRMFLPEGEFTPEVEQWFRRLEMQPID